MTPLSMQEKINGFLQFLTANKIDHWAYVIEGQLFPSEEETAIATIQNVSMKLTRMGAHGASGIVVGSTVQLLEKYDPTLLPTECTVILSTLRDQNRIIQIGKGRGKALVIVTGDAVTYAGPEDINPYDRKAVLKALQEAVTDDMATIEKLTHELKVKDAQIHAQATEIRKLRQQQSVSDRLSWG